MPSEMWVVLAYGISFLCLINTLTSLQSCNWNVAWEISTLTLNPPPQPPIAFIISSPHLYYRTTVGTNHAWYCVGSEHQVLKKAKVGRHRPDSSRADEPSEAKRECSWSDDWLPQAVKVVKKYSHYHSKESQVVDSQVPEASQHRHEGICGVSKIWLTHRARQGVAYLQTDQWPNWCEQEFCSYYGEIVEGERLQDHRSSQGLQA